MLAEVMSARHTWPQVSPAYMRSAKPSRFLSSTVRSEGIAQLMSGTLSFRGATVGSEGDAAELVTPELACQTTFPLKASTTRMPRPLVRETVVGDPVGLAIVQVPAEV